MSAPWGKADARNKIESLGASREIVLLPAGVWSPGGVCGPVGYGRAVEAKTNPAPLYGRAAGPAITHHHPIRRNLA